MRPSKSRAPITELLQKWAGGNESARDELIRQVHGELRHLAVALMRREKSPHTLEPSALINEAYLRLIGQGPGDWQSRAHFYGIAARLMRQILVEHARKKYAAKRGAGDRVRVDNMDQLPGPEIGADLITLNDALAELERIDARKAHLIDLKFFGGLNTEEIARTVGISPSTVGRELRLAQAWLHKQIRASL